jgi:drug/metabolite transporter (DMT)-like permease
MMEGRRLAPGATYVVLGEFMFASTGVGIRFVAAEMPNEVVVCFRHLISALLLAPWLLKGVGRGLATTVPWLHLRRALASLGQVCLTRGLSLAPAGHQRARLGPWATLPSCLALAMAGSCGRSPWPGGPSPDPP